MRDHKKLFRALLWFGAAAIFLYAIFNTSEEDFNARFEQDEPTMQQEADE